MLADGSGAGSATGGSECNQAFGLLERMGGENMPALSPDHGRPSGLTGRLSSAFSPQSHTRLAENGAHDTTTADKRRRDDADATGEAKGLNVIHLVQAAAATYAMAIVNSSGPGTLTDRYDRQRHLLRRLCLCNPKRKRFSAHLTLVLNNKKNPQR